MLDVHILTSLDTNPDWMQKCIGSVLNAAANAGFPVNVRAVIGIPGHIGSSRAIGYSRGSHPYVTSVDDDDYVTPDAFRCLGNALLQLPGAIYTREIELQNDHLTQTDRRHHLAIYRRGLLDNFDFEAWPCYDAMALRKHAEASGETIIDLPDAVYVHRLYGNSKARVLQRARPDIWEKVRG